MGEIWQLGAVGVARLIRERELSSIEVVDAFLRRIEVVNPTINAVIVLSEERAMDEARSADADLARHRPLRPLHGVPFTVKDVFDTAGVETSVGIPERIGKVPMKDAVAVARLRGAGGILLGKTNLPPGGSGGVTDNAVHGRTNNPYDRERSPAGSSGGEAAIQGAGGSPVGLGSDSGGSLRLPAHFCGVAALKPTSGRVPNTGAFQHPGGLSDTRTQIGPLSRFVEDLAPILKIVAGPDGRDSGVVPMPVSDPEAVELRGLRVAFYTDDGSTPTTPETAATVKDAVGALVGAGATVTEACPERIGPIALDITHRYWGWDELPGGETARLLDDWDRFRTRLLAFMDSVDVIVCPTSPGPASLHGEGLESMFNYTLPFSLSGQPSVVVPLGASEEGLPIGVQVVGRVWRDDVALGVARSLEQMVGGWRTPPI
ncbi:MAG: amidase [Actinomycetota bacterium]|nr:amidase [Actinomycetota bacterium]